MHIWNKPNFSVPTRPDERRMPLGMCWSAPATCGEFLQGRLDGIDFLINSPIDRYSMATVQRQQEGITVGNPEAHAKVVELLERLAARVRFRHGFHITLNSDIPQGKGMASSTADLVAALGAALAQARHSLSVADCARLLVEVEPSDCTHIPGIGHVGHLCGRIFGCLAVPVGLRVMVVDCGGTIDTTRFDRSRAHHVYATHERELRDALTLALRSFSEGDSVGLAHAATRSARLSQQILPKPQFPDLLAITREQGALGVNCAHSGSVLGVLYQPDDCREEVLERAIRSAFGADLPIIGDHSFIPGGDLCHPPLLRCWHAVRTILRSSRSGRLRGLDGHSSTSACR